MPAPAPAAVPLLDRMTYVIKEHVGMLKFSDTYDILDPETGERIGIAKEKPGALVHVLRFVLNKQMLPTTVHIGESEDQPLLTIRRGFAIIRPKISIRDAQGVELGYFKSKIFSLGGGFHVYSPAGEKIAEVKGDWKGWNFRFLDTQGREIGVVAKKWAGLAKEFFTSADTYAISLNEGAKGMGGLLLAAGLAIDIVLKESSS